MEVENDDHLYDTQLQKRKHNEQEFFDEPKVDLDFTKMDVWKMINSKVVVPSGPISQSLLLEDHNIVARRVKELPVELKKQAILSSAESAFDIKNLGPSSTLNVNQAIDV